MAHRIAFVAVEKAGFHFDKLYSYLIPERFEERAVIGARVVVPFGKGNGKSVGIVFDIRDTTDIEKVKPISDFPDREPVADERTCRLAEFLKEHTFCTLFEGVRAQLPAGINLKMVAEYRLLREATEAERDAFTPEERTAVFCLANAREPVASSRLDEILGDAAEETLEKLSKAGLIERTDQAVRTLGDASVRVVSLADEETVENYFSVKRSDPQTRVLSFLREVGTASVKEVNYFTGVTAGVLKTLEHHGVVTLSEQEVYRRPEKGERVSLPDGDLTSEQQKAVKGLLSLYEKDAPAAALLYGVTGSGKTRVYLDLIRRALSDGQNCIVMVPEIALTPQTAALFYAAFGDRVAILHSGLSMGERTDEWKRLRRGEASVALGTRSAVFAPFPKVGLIIMDEEQESAYKSESTPRYHARDVAKYLAVRDSALLVLGSATPSVETMYYAQNGRYSLFTMKTRYGKATLPRVTVCDISREEKGKAVGRTLAEEIQKNLDAKEQIILLHNRRGYNTFVVCEDCRTVFTCPNCSVSMTYHSANGRLMCHYCGYSCTTDVTCRSCGSKQMRFSGTGTQKVEDELNETFPGVRLLRMDADTTACKNGHDRILSEFAKGGYDILLGTQMVAKGLDFPSVTLVGVLSADQTLYCEDFRATERAFSLLTQVAGRSGRGNKAGRAVIQTFTPENPVFEQSASQDYMSFYEEEIARRKLMTYPPFCDICEVCFSGQSEAGVKKGTMNFFDRLVGLCGEHPEIPLKVLNPSPASVARMGNRSYYRLIIKCRNDKPFRAFLSRLLCDFARDKANRGVTASADINPSALL